MSTKVLIALLLSMLVCASVSAAITVTIELPTPDQVVGPGPDVRAAVTSDLSLQSVVADIEGRSTILTLSNGKWVGWVNINGFARGTHTLVVTATDVQNNTATAQRNIFLDYYPVVQVTGPLPYSVGRPKVRFTATCTDDDPNGCASLRIAVSNNLTTVYQSPSPASLSIELDGGTTYRVVGTDSAGRMAIVEVPVVLETSGRLRTFANAPSRIRDFDGSRLLFRNDYASYQLGIYDIATGAIDPMNSTARTASSRAFLSPAGAIFLDGFNMYEWRNGAMIGPLTTASDLLVEGTFASFRYSGALYRRDLTTGTDALIGPGFDPEPAANGHVAYASSRDVYRYDGISSTLLDGGSDFQDVPRTAGGDVLYWRQPPVSGAAGSWWIHNGTTAFSISPSFAGTGFGSDIAGNWAVVSVPDLSGNRQLWRRAPGATSATQATIFNFDHLLERVAPNGEFLYYPYPGANQGQYLCGTAYDSAAILVTPQQNIEGSFYVGGRWYLAEGRMLLQVESPNDEIGGDHRSDVLWRDTTSGKLSLWEMYGATPDNFPSLPAIGSPWVAQTGDFNGDGTADVLWRNPSTDQTSIWFMRKTIIGGTNLPNLPSFWETYPGDYNGDGHDDLLLRNVNSGQVSMWLLRNGGIIAGGNLPSLLPPWKLYAGDFNADGKTDVYLQNPTTGDNTIWFLSGPSIIGGKPMPTIPSPWQAYVGNYNGDAHADILWRNTSTGDNSIWIMQSGVIITGGDLPNMPVAAIPYRGDFNGDFKSDILWHVPNATGMTIMMMNGPAVASTHALTRSANQEILNLD